MSTAEESKTTHKDPRAKRIAVFAAIVIVAFLLGLIPMGIRAWSRANERDAAQRQLRLCTLQLTLASAAISARAGNYEPARLATSDFFTALHNQLDPGNGTSDLTASQRESVKPLLNDRDNLITLLARGDPASADRLSDLYLTYEKTTGNSQK